MAIEIEKKFLLKKDFPIDLLKRPIFISQGYISRTKAHVIRIRICGEKACITLKSPTIKAVRKEFEYPVPTTDAKEMVRLFCKDPVIEKNRYRYEYKGFTWEIDQFLGKNQGLIVAEIELESVDQPFEKPDWIGKEVTEDPRYFNSNLVHYPYQDWQ